MVTIRRAGVANVGRRAEGPQQVPVVVVTGRHDGQSEGVDAIAAVDVCVHEVGVQQVGLRRRTALTTSTAMRGFTSIVQRTSEWGTPTAASSE